METEVKKKKGSGIEKAATFIVDRRNLFFLLYIFAIVFSLISRNWVNVENDITTYLPDDTETRQGLTVMDDNFITYGSARVMVSNIAFDTAETLCEQIEAVPGVDTVAFDDTTDHYTDTSALYTVSFTGVETDPESVAAMHEIESLLAGYDTYVDTAVGVDETAQLQQEMLVIVAVAAVIIVVVLVLTSRAYAEVPVLILTFLVAALLNMGTNFLCGTISYISNSVTVVLQLALAIDYAIILCHRFSDEHETLGAREACIAALSKAIPEISSSSLTTISGLGALAFMHFGIGLDLAVVLIKAILLSLLAVFTLMPGLLMLFSKKIDATQHRNLIPKITFLGRFDVKTRFLVPPIFLVAVVGAFFLSNKCPYSYTYTDLVTPKQSERQIAYQKIKNTFGVNNMIAVIVPAGNYPAEKAILQKLEKHPEVKSTMGLANIEAKDGYMLTDSVTPRQFSELAGLDYEVAKLLYSAYAVDHDQYGEIINGLQNFRVPLYDMFMFLKTQMENGNIDLEGDTQDTLDDLFDQLEKAQLQLQSDAYSRMVVYLTVPEESTETFAFLDTVHALVGQYYPADSYVVGNTTSAIDLSGSFSNDNTLISVLSALFVVIILLFTFQSAGLPVLLIMVIQGSIWMNFSFPYLQHKSLYFLGYLIVESIQMGANIDYAIVISSHYSELKHRMKPAQALVEALNASFPTIFTSGAILASAGELISVMTANPVIAAIGECLGRGTIISMVLVLAVLPQILLLGDSIIERTSFALPGINQLAHSETGAMRIQGHVTGMINGVLNAEVNGVLRGQFNAIIGTGGMVEKIDERALPEHTPPRPEEPDGFAVDLKGGVEQ